MEQVKVNPLGSEPIGKLMIRFSLPSIAAMLVSALYNIVDQFFIGQTVGPLGNAATNIAFPLAMSCTAIALLFGIGGASQFNLHMGRGEKEKAPFFTGNAVVMLILCGTVLFLACEILLDPMLYAFGSPDDVFPYAREYVRITAIGFPFLILTVGGGHLIRADGSPNMSLICSFSGAIINTVLDWVFTMKLDLGIAGAAYATVIGQMFSAFLVIRYMMHYKTVHLGREHLKLKGKAVAAIASVGVASFINQIAMMMVQIVSNNVLKKYGGMSVYGESIPIACAGVVTKVNQVFFSIVIGIAQGSQPIESFNYGARNYERVRKTYALAVISASIISIGSFAAFQLFPRQILSFFGDGSPEYFEFGTMYFRIYLFFAWLNCLQPMTNTFFTSIGKAVKGAFLSMTRQIIFLLPLILILTRMMGITGILYAGPGADLLAAICAIVMAVIEFKNIKKLEIEEKSARVSNS